VAVGQSATVTSSGVAVGVNAVASGVHGVAIGQSATADNTRSTAVGYSATTAGFASTVLGAESTATAHAQFVCGSSALGIYTVIIGAGESTTVNQVGSPVTYRTARIATSETDKSGASVIWQSGAGTGAAPVSTITFQTPTVTGTGTTQQALATRLTVAETALTATTHLLFSADNTLDIGATGATRPRRVHVGTEVVVGATVTIGSAAVTGSGALTVTATAANLTLAATGANTVIVQTNGAARLTVADATVTVADAVDFVFNTTTGTKFGTATGQKIGFFNAAPVIQRTNVANPTGGATIDAEARTAIDDILSRLETLGLFAA
jgi:hypothetical protein